MIRYLRLDFQKQVFRRPKLSELLARFLKVGSGVVFPQWLTEGEHEIIEIPLNVLEVVIFLCLFSVLDECSHHPDMTQERVDLSHSLFVGHRGVSGSLGENALAAQKGRLDQWAEGLGGGDGRGAKIKTVMAPQMTRSKLMMNRGLMSP